MPLTTYDKESLPEILNNNQGTYFTAHLLRFLNTVLTKSDATNLRKLLDSWPDECKLIYRHYGWSDREIANVFLSTLMIDE